MKYSLNIFVQNEQISPTAIHRKTSPLKSLWEAKTNDAKSKEGQLGIRERQIIMATNRYLKELFEQLNLPKYLQTDEVIPSEKFHFVDSDEFNKYKSQANSYGFCDYLGGKIVIERETSGLQMFYNTLHKSIETLQRLIYESDMSGENIQLIQKGISNTKNPEFQSLNEGLIQLCVHDLIIQNSQDIKRIIEENESQMQNRANKLEIVSDYRQGFQKIYTRPIDAHGYPLTIAVEMIPLFGLKSNNVNKKELKKLLTRQHINTYYKYMEEARNMLKREVFEPTPNFMTKLHKYLHKTFTELLRISNNFPAQSFDTESNQILPETTFLKMLEEAYYGPDNNIQITSSAN